jgi:hypothetical protein
MPDLKVVENPLSSLTFWVVWREGGSSPTFRHYNQYTAEREATRLAAQNPGVAFHTLKVEATFCIPPQPVQVTRKFIEETPF